MPHGYEVLVADEVVTIGPTFLLDVIYNHEAVSSAASRLVEFAVKVCALVGGNV